MRGFVPSKNLLLYGVIRNDNSANNGGTFIVRQFGGPKVSKKQIKAIPWEVYYKFH